MTRINVVPVSELTNKHLMAEYREIMRLPKNLKTALTRSSKPFRMSEVPNEYRLGPGHVKFFFNKFLYLKERFIQLANELDTRKFNINKELYADMLLEFDSVDSVYKNQYVPDDKALAINRLRIKERLGNS